MAPRTYTALYHGCGAGIRTAQHILDGNGRRAWMRMCLLTPAIIEHGAQNGRNLGLEGTEARLWKAIGEGGWVTSPIIAAVSVRANPSIPMPRKLMRSSRKLSQSPGRNVAKSICANSTRNWSRCAGVDMRCDADGVSCCFMETRIASAFLLSMILLLHKLAHRV